MGALSAVLRGGSDGPWSNRHARGDLPGHLGGLQPSETWRIPRGASSVGVYRLWRDLGYAIGALLAGLTADALGLPAAMWLVAALTFASGVVVAVRMTETLAALPNTPSVSPAARGNT